MRYKKFSIVCLLVLLILNTSAQLIPIHPVQSKNSPQINYVFNRIFNGNLDAFYQKLYNLKKSDSGVVNIVHIGDSHIQADFFSGFIRNGLQQDFGNAGRGLIFPYQLAKTNSPLDIQSYSNTGWSYNRVAHPEIHLAPGISGYGIQTTMQGATINISLKPDENSDQSFKRMRFFIDDNPSSAWSVKIDDNSFPHIIDNNENDSLLYHEVHLENSINNFTVSLLSGDTARSFYGVSLENDESGILYHSIGVNGARYDHYNITPLFWQQLPALKADLYIISLGTNEAQNNVFDEAEFRKQVTLFLQKLKITSPDAAVLITIPADSYKGRYSNFVLKQLNTTLYNYCTENNIAVWDLYRITNSFGSARGWLQRGLMNKDRIHFTAEGYRLQGQLLLNALERGYNNYISIDQNLK